MTTTEDFTYNGHPVIGMNDGGVPLCNSCWSIGQSPMTRETHPHGFKCARCWRQYRANGEPR